MAKRIGNPGMLVLFLALLVGCSLLGISETCAAEEASRIEQVPGGRSRGQGEPAGSDRPLEGTLDPDVVIKDTPEIIGDPPNPDPSPPIAKQAPEPSWWDRWWIVAVAIASLLATIALVYYRSFLFPGVFPLGAGPEIETIVDMVVSDAAIAHANEDRLGTSRLAKGLSLFLRNQNTQPPVTLAITGGWGSGKSSVMAMLKESLKEARYCPVWFNAWHHQHEEQLLGALLETIRQEGIPPIWRFSGIVFRLRLFARRAWRHLSISLVIIFTGLSIGLLWHFGVFSKESLSKALSDPTNKLLVGTSILAVSLGLFVSLFKGLTAFGVTPTQLFRSVSHAFRPVNLNTHPGLRYQVTQALGDITWALGRRTLVIFIDDLDRCPPNRVMEVLDWVNFLSSTPCRTYIVLGMALDKVLPNISGEFHRIVEEASSDHDDEDEEQRNRRLKKERFTYARHYLEKMINIEIHIPPAPVEKMAQLAEPATNAAKPTKSRKEQLNWLIRMADQRIFPVILIAAISFGLYFGVQKLAPPTGGATGTQAHEQAQGYWKYGLMGGAGSFALIVLLGYLMSRRAEISDPPQFIKALQTWTEVITIKNHTPRHYKRAVNQLRLLAMRMEDGSPTADQESKNEQIIRFVMLKALRELGADSEKFDLILSLFKDESFETEEGARKRLEGYLRQNLKFEQSDLSGAAKDPFGVLTQAIIRHDQYFGDEGWPTKTHAQRYDDLMQGITLH